MEWCGKRGGSVGSQAEQEWGCMVRKEGGNMRLLVQILDCSFGLNSKTGRYETVKMQIFH